MPTRRHRLHVSHAWVRSRSRSFSHSGGLDRPVKRRTLFLPPEARDCSRESRRRKTNLAEHKLLGPARFTWVSVACAVGAPTVHLIHAVAVPTARRVGQAVPAAMCHPPPWRSKGQ